MLIDKPKGITSFDCIRTLQHKYGRDIKMGHAGTLDPLATGLMLIGTGMGTSKLSELAGLDKQYQADILLGLKTTTGDMAGDVLEERAVVCPDKNEVERILLSLRGEVMLRVPLFSAVKRGGKRFYSYARELDVETIRGGDFLQPPLRAMRIDTIVANGSRKNGEKCVLSVVMDVGSGTYVRSIAEEIGERLGVPATVKELRRTRIGDFYIEDAVSLNEA